MTNNSRKVIIVNQAVNYLTIGICNEFANQFEHVCLITGSIHVQGEELDPKIEISRITKWQEQHGLKKAWIYLSALIQIYTLLIFNYRKYEVFFVSAPPMGYLLNIILPHKCSMLIWDVFPDTFKITGMTENHLVYKSWGMLNKISFKKAFKLFTIGKNMKTLLSQYVEENKIIVQPIWSIFQEKTNISKSENPFVQEHDLQGKFVIQYSGNIGLTHKVETMVLLAEKMQSYDDIVFQIIGRGPRKNVLENLVIQKELKNCHFLPFQSDEMFPSSLSAADVGVVILDEQTAKGSVPSKSYNLMSYGIPSLYISSPDSELANYVSRFKHGACFSEKNLDDAIEFILLVKNNKSVQNELRKKSLIASENFKRVNAKKLVEAYMEDI